MVHLFRLGYLEQHLFSRLFERRTLEYHNCVDFGKAWSEGSTGRKREIQKAIFPNGLPLSVRKRKNGDFEPSNVIKGQPFESIFDALRPIGVPDGI